MRISLYAASSFAIIAMITCSFPRGISSTPLLSLAYASSLYPMPMIIPDLGIATSSAATTTAAVTAASPKNTLAPSKAKKFSGSASMLTSKITDSRYPARVIIPAININAPIQRVGVTATNAMAVPSGASNRVGWYEYGTIPGEVGSAVLDAHVFAEFANLRYLKPGNDIYIMTEGGTTLHFVVMAAKTYPLAALDPHTLFGQNDARRLNLITCAGELTPDHSTYDHRLVVYAELVS